VIDNERLESALAYLSHTDELSASLKADVARREYACDLARRRVFLLATGSIEERKAFAEVHEDVQRAEGQRADAIVAYERIRAKRTTEALIVDVWRSVESSRRAGAMT
jgi:hypothetical protein